MAARGAKPKPAALRLVTGTHNTTRHGKKGDAQTAVETAATAFGPLDKPGWLQGDASSAWDKWIAPAPWLDGSKEAAAIAFCELWREFRYDPTGFTAGKHGQMRAYMAELGLTDERNRKAVDAESKDPADKYF